MLERDIIALFLADYSASIRETKPRKKLEKNLTQLDDCALIDYNNNSNKTKNHNKKIISTDSLVENVHFRLDWSSPEDLAIKLFQSNLSDIVSSGGQADWCLLNIGLPQKLIREHKKKQSHKPSEKSFSFSFIERFAKKLRYQCHTHKCPLIGGDTFSSELLFLSLTIGGNAKRYISRSGASIGDQLYLSGDIGLSSLGLSLLKGELKLDPELKKLALEKHLRPQARLSWGKKLASMPEVHAMTDLSDDLIISADNLAKASGLSISINLEDIPVHPSLRKILGTKGAKNTDKNSRLDELMPLLSGEEFELLFLAKAGLSFPFPCKAIGETTKQINLVKLNHKRKNIDDNPSVSLTRSTRIIKIPLKHFEHF